MMNADADVCIDQEAGPGVLPSRLNSSAQVMLVEVNVGVDVDVDVEVEVEVEVEVDIDVDIDVDAVAVAADSRDTIFFPSWRKNPTTINYM